MEFEGQTYLNDQRNQDMLLGILADVGTRGIGNQVAS